jgi:hypothetical protein
MKKIVVVAVLILFVGISLKCFAQGMTPPKPAENKVLDAMAGEWTGVSEMMGMKFNDNLKFYWNLNHQFMFMEMKGVGKDNPAMTYSGLAIIGVNLDGSAKVWWFDDWGTMGTASGTGTFGDMKFSANTSNEMYKDNHMFEVNGNELTLTWNSTMNMAGKETKMEGKTVYKRK